MCDFRISLHWLGLWQLLLNRTVHLWLLHTVIWNRTQHLCWRDLRLGLGIHGWHGSHHLIWHLSLRCGLRSGITRYTLTSLILRTAGRITWRIWCTWLWLRRARGCRPRLIELLRLLKRLCSRHRIRWLRQLGRLGLLRWQMLVRDGRISLWHRLLDIRRLWIGLWV
jgi:hypothetical protein